MRMTHIMSPTTTRIKTPLKNASLFGLTLSAVTLALSIHPAVNAAPASVNEPMLHPVPKARLTSPFGEQNKFHKFHNGIDLAAKLDTAVVAAASGRIITATEKLKGFEAYGTVLVIDHGSGLKSVYAHLNSFDVSEGEQVESGQLIGRVGSTGRSTGPHLHFEVLKNGERVNPQDFIALK